MKDSMRLFYEMEIKRDGKRVKKYRKRICHSFVKAFIDYLYYLLTKYPTTMRDTSGNYYSANNPYGNYETTNRGWKCWWYGPVVGTGYKRRFITPYGTWDGPAMSSAITPAPYVVTSSAFNSSYPTWQVFDGSSSTFCIINSSSSQFIKLDTGAGPTKIAKNFWIRTYTDAYYSPKNFTLQGSNDDAIWDTLYTGTNVVWSNSETKYFTLSPQPAIAYRYYKLNVTDKQGSASTELRIATLEIEATTETSIMPISVTDYAMADTGVSLSYGANNVLSPVTTSGGSTFTIYRIFDNQSGSDITINEIGLYARAYQNGPYFLFARDIISPVTITTGETLTINYIIETNI